MSQTLIYQALSRLICVCRRTVVRRYSAPLRNGHKTASLFTESTVYKWREDDESKNPERLRNALGMFSTMDSLLDDHDKVWPPKPKEEPARKTKKRKQG